MKVQLMLTCLCDAFYGEVGIAATKVLRACACEVLFANEQTCCGQPPYNSGDWSAARKVADRFQHVFEAGIPVVTPSGSCAAMVREGYPQLFPERSHLECFEIGEFVVRNLGILSVPGSRGFDAPTKVAFRARYAKGVVLECKTDSRSFGVKFEGTEGWFQVLSGGLQSVPASLKDGTLGPNDTPLEVSRNHYRNFLDCVKSRKEPIEPVEVGHRTGLGGRKEYGAGVGQAFVEG